MRCKTLGTLMMTVRMDGPMDGFFGEVEMGGGNYIVWLDFTWSRSKNVPDFIRLFSNTVAHEELEMQCLEELGPLKGKNMWCMDFFPEFEINRLEEGL